MLIETRHCLSLPTFPGPHLSLVRVTKGGEGGGKEMGIQGLLPLLKSIMLPIHMKELRGCCVAVDTYSWLHKGALSCSAELCKGLPTSRLAIPKPPPPMPDLLID